MGRVYESPRSNIKSKDFEFFSTRGDYTDDSILTTATADWLLHGGEAARYYSTYGLKYRPQWENMEQPRYKITKTLCSAWHFPWGERALLL